MRVQWSNPDFNVIGYLGDMLNDADPRPAREQLDEAYAHGGGFRPFSGFTLLDNGISYPGDPVMSELSRAQLRDESIRFYQGAWVAIVQPDGTHVISRMD